MLKHVWAVLRELKLPGADSPARYNITIGTGNAMAIGVYPDSGGFLLVKASEIDDLTREYNAQLRGWDQYRELVPQPLGYRVREGWHIIVTQGVRHAAFPFTALAGAIPNQRVVDDLFRYFEICTRHKATRSGATPQREFLTTLELYFADSPYADVAGYWIGQGRLLGMETLDQVTQHGDFTQNNLAISGGRLVIFDWEDFGKYQLPGLDICSLCASLTPDAAALRDLMRAGRAPDQPMEAFLRRACTLCELDPEVLRRLLPLYLLVFLYVKREYGYAAQNRIGALVRQLTP